MENIAYLPAHQLRHLFCMNQLSAEEIVKAFLARIDRLDGKVGAFLAVYHEQALNKARALDKKRQAGEKLGKLAAVPIALKDNIHLKGELTTCASKFLTNYYAPFDATVTRLIEEEDGIIIGKTNLDEFAMGSSTEYSALLKTKNPWNLACVPGGSSGGSAAAVAARFCPIALGSDTGGSVRLPASYCGIAGFKPTYGRISRYGLVAFGSSLDQIGPFTHDMEDMALIMEVLGRHCEKDSTSLNQPADLYDLNQTVSGLKIGVPWEFLKGLPTESLEKFNQAIKTLEALGAKTADVDLNILKYSIAVYYIVSSAEASTNLARFDGVRYGMRSKEAKTLDEVYDLSKEEGFGPEVKRRILLGTYVLSSGYQDAYYKQAQRVRRLILDQFNKIFAECDLIAMPVSATPAFEFGAKKDPLTLYLEDIYTIAANLAGLPAISVPNGLTKEGRPMGLQLIGKQKNDAGVILAANAFNKATNYLEKEIPTLE
jgi:aspartyl-tRNA(Asn)/glutamyl-tRNA(Gln) amidotransferase subunit A